MKIDLIYNGQILKWNDKGLSFKATSGMVGHQMPGEQCLPDAGPVPEGVYKVYISDHGLAKDDGRGICALKPSWGIQEIPRGVKAGSCEPYWANWGKIGPEWSLQMKKPENHVRQLREVVFTFMIQLRVLVMAASKLTQGFSNTYVVFIQLQKRRQ